MLSDDANQSEPVARRPGRPRSVQADRVILDAALRSLVEAGYAGTSIEGVAVRAGVGKTTIYRRWESKEALVTAALRTLNEEIDLPDTGSVRDDLRLLLEQFARNTLSSAIWPAFNRAIGASLEAPELMEILLKNLVQPRLRALAGVIERARLRGELRASVDARLLSQVIGGTILVGVIFGLDRTPVQPDARERLIDLLLEGALARDLESYTP
jgi:AcrR family transcriptional regulator